MRSPFSKNDPYISAMHEAIYSMDFGPAPSIHTFYTEVNNPQSTNQFNKYMRIYHQIHHNTLKDVFFRAVIATV